MYGRTIISQFLKSNVGWVKVKLYNFHMKTKIKSWILKGIYEKKNYNFGNHIMWVWYGSNHKIFNVTDSAPLKMKAEFLFLVFTKESDTTFSSSTLNYVTYTIDFRFVIDGSTIFIIVSRLFEIPGNNVLTRSFVYNSVDYKFWITNERPRLYSKHWTFNDRLCLQTTKKIKLLHSKQWLFW